MARLVIISGPDAGREFPLGDSAVIGRLGKNAVAIKGDTASSREHARVYRQGIAYFVVDLGSRNGTIVNGAPVQKSELTPADQLLVGATTFRLALDPEDLAAPVPVAAPSPDRARSPGGVDVAVRASGPSGARERALQFSPHAATGRRRVGGGTSSASALRADLAQSSAAYRILVAAGAVLLAAGLGYLAYFLSAA